MNELLSSSDVAPPHSKLKVLHVGKFYPPHMGGIETHLEALCGALRESIDVRVVVASNDHRSTDEVLDGVPVSRVATALTLFSTPFCPALVSKIRNSDADLVHIHLPNPAAVLAYLASRHPGRVLFTYHSDTVRQRKLGALFEPVLHKALRRSSAIIATSPDYVRTSPVLSAYRDRCHVIPYGIPVERFERYDADAVQRLRQQYGERLIISVGRLVYYKGFEHLIRAMTRVSGKLLIVGDGPLRTDLENLTAQIGVKDKVVFTGAIQNHDIVPYYHAADVFVLASVARSEAFGIVQIEAMAAGKPVVNTQLDSGVPFVSLHEKTGLTVLPGDPEALAAAINQLLNNESLRLSLGNAARERARQKFSLEAMASRTVKLYEEIVASSIPVPVQRDLGHAVSISRIPTGDN